MRRHLLFPVLLLATYAVLASAQQPPAAAAPPQGGIKLSDVAGTWNVKSMIGPRDSVVATYVLTATADEKTWTLKFPNRDPLPVRITARGGDSIVAEVGPYNSVLRPGVMVTTRTNGHYKGNEMSGTFRAVYATGDTLRGKIAGTRTP